LNYNLSQKIAAWGVHAFTSSGLITGFLALIAIGEKNWSVAFLWLFVSLVIDGVDGSLARLFKVKEVLPSMDGKNIDFVIDFANYAIVPAYFFYMAEMVPQSWMFPCLTLILLSSALYYGKDGMVADEQYFVGFPVLWNIVVFYCFFIFQNNLELNVAIVVIFAILHFVPVKYAYPSRSKKYFWLHLIVSLSWFIGAGLVLFYFPQRIFIIEVLLIAVIFYFAVIAMMDTWGNSSD
jgi:phosphatidylcholine synthase